MEALVELLRGGAHTLTELLEVVFELLSAFTILVGLVVTLRDLPRGVRAVQLGFARFLLLALEFLLAADILATVRAPTLDDLLRLGAVAAIRTFLDYYLSRELREPPRPQPSATGAAERPR